MKGQILLILPIALLATLAGCGSPQHEATERYVLIANNTKVPYWQAAIAGLNRAGRSMNVKTEVAGPENYDPKVQHEEFEKIIQQKPTGILISAGDSRLIQPDINAAIERGIPVITIDSDVQDSKRLHGYQDTFAAYPALKTTRVIDTKGNAGIAFDMTKELLQNGAGKVDAFVCLESTSCAEVTDVFECEHVTNKVVVAMDSAPRTPVGIQKGVITATIGQMPFTMGFFGLKMLDDIHHNNPGTLDRKWSENFFSPIPSFVDTGATLIDGSNVHVFLTALQSETEK
jgi:ribose transport system substrate-binding protein